MAENKTQKTKASVAAFIDAVENETRRKDAKTLVKLMGEVSGEKPAMWGPSIVGFGACHYKYESGREGDMPMIAFSPRKPNLVLYVISGSKEEGALLARLGKHKIGKSCLYLGKLADVDMDVLEDLTRRSYAHAKKKYG